MAGSSLVGPALSAHNTLNRDLSELSYPPTRLLPAIDLGTFMETTAASEADNRAFLDAVQDVLQRKSAATEADLISAAACQFLRRGPGTTDEILIAVRRIWPRFDASKDIVLAALGVSTDLGLTAWDDTKQIWFLTADGLADIQQHAKWVNGLRERTTAEIRVRTRQGIGLELDADEANLWLDTLVAALVPAIDESLRQHLGSARMLIEGKITPRATDNTSVQRALENSSPRVEVVQLLQSLALSALDPLDPFGLELVTHIATGCVLHSYVSGSSKQTLTHALGEAQSQRAILDTPVLISLIGPAKDQRDAELSIKQASSQGWDVVVPKHSLEELNELVDRELPRLQRLYQEAHERNARIDFYAALVDDQFHGIIITALQEGTYERLSDVTKAVQELPGRLQELGATVREHGNEISPDRRDKCKKALAEYLNRTNRPRSPKVIARDAETMTMAWRRRRRETSAHWPGAWIITTDQAMNPAYSSISSDRVSITLSLAQWTTVIAISARPTELVQLATVAAGQFVDEAVWQLPARFPEEFAIKLAAQLSPEQGGSNLDLHQAQVMRQLPEMLDQIASNASPTVLASKVLAERTKRLNALNELDRTHRDKQIAAAYIDATSAQERELRTQRQLNQILQENTRLNDDLTAAQNEKSDTEKRLADQAKRHIRILWSIPIVLGTVIWLVMAVVFGSFLVQAFSAVLLLASLVLTFQWCRKLDTSLRILAWSIAIEALGAISAVQSLLTSAG